MLINCELMIGHGKLSHYMRKNFKRKIYLLKKAKRQIVFRLIFSQK